MSYFLSVMGNPIEHSKSPWIHDQFAKQFDLQVNYIGIKPELNEFNSAVTEFQRNHGFGFNITLPFKQEAFKLAAVKSKRAEIAKAVNTMMFQPDGTLFGDNTDGIGLLNDITKNLCYSLTGKTIVILGAGGAIRGILEPLLSQSPTKLIIANRTVQNARQLASEFKTFGSVVGCGFNDLTNLTVDVIIDGTGFNADIKLPESLQLSEESLSYDLKYSNTDFLRWAKRKGCKLISDGLGMLVEQAAEAFLIWTGKKPDTCSVIQLAKEMFYLSK